MSVLILILSFNFMRKILSYIFPLRLKNYSSEINGQLEINVIHGRKTLDNATCNLSYGSL